MPAKIENETPTERLARIREKARIRGATYYLKHTEKVLQKRKEAWQKLKNDVHQEALANMSSHNENVYEPEPQPEPEYFEPVYEPPTVIAAERRRSTRVRKPVNNIATPEVIVAVPQTKQRGRPKGATSKAKCNETSKYTTEYILGELKKIDNKADGTTKINVDKITTLLAITSPTLDCDWLNGLSKPTLITEKIDNALMQNSTSKYSTNSKIIYVNLIQKIIDNIIPELVSVKPKYDNYLDNLKYKGANEKKEKIVDVYRYDILKQKIFAKFKENSKERLLTSLYGEITVRDNFSKLKIIHKMNEIVLDKETNYLILPSSSNDYRAHIYLQKYKTSNKYEDLEFKCSLELTDEIMEYYKKNIEKIHRSGDYLFGVSKLSGYIGTMLKKIGIDNKGMAINYFRHSVALSLDKSNTNEQSVVDLAKEMGHSIMTHLRYTSHNLIE